ncbi:extracellular solute-binding protein [Cetobacterium sp. 2A]|uniref:ABC transporter substrate-binding protein n=1 Tax=unclassified Cetobacterium TaxID=2630983 RepID=UPI00163CEB71|nr:extracellular solute-binding protein [Cetobacterium sp. 2A]MBC2855553.1 extracellular solute-binding protein [Cetobacterium sp. 2A]
MKKMNFLTLSLNLIFFIFTGCSQNSDDNISDNKIKEIRVAFESLTDNHLARLEKVIKKFEEKNENISIKLDIKKTDYLKELNDDFETNNPPDVFISGSSFSKINIKKNRILDLTKKYEEYEKNEMIYKQTMKHFSENDKIYAYPTGFYSSIIFYNKEILKKYKIEKPQNFEDFKNVLVKLKNNNVIPLGKNLIYTNLKDTINKLGLENDKRLNFYLKMEEEKLFVSINELGFKNKYEAFASGNVAFIIGIAADIEEIKFYKPNFGILETFSNESEFFISLGYCISQNSKYPEESFEFVKFLHDLTVEGAWDLKI